MTKFYYLESLASSSPALADKSKKRGGNNAENYVIYIYGNHKTLISDHGTITIYIIVTEVSCMHLLCAIYQNQKGVWLVCFCFFWNKFQYQT